MAYEEPKYLPWDGRRVPITFVGGYLGAGKTTAINALLAQTDRPIAVLVNDVGEINIDAALIKRRHGDTVELTDGCVCCSLLDGFGAAFDQLRARPAPPDHVIVELSGVAEPQRVTPWGNSAGFSLDGVVIVVAADQLIDEAMPERIREALEQQISHADLLILTKTDIVTLDEAQQARDRLDALALGVPTLETGDRDAAVNGSFLGLGGRRPEGAAAVSHPTLFDAHTIHTVAMPTGLTLQELDHFLDGVLSGDAGCSDSGTATTAAMSSAVNTSAANSLPPAGSVTKSRGASGAPSIRSEMVVRAKGVAATADGTLVLIQVVGNRREVTELPAAEWQASTDLTVITLSP